MNEQQTEQAIIDAGKTAPRVTPADLDAEIAAGSVYYFTALEGVIGNQLLNNPTGQGHVGGIENGETLGLITICCIVLANGFKVIGTSAPVSASNFRAEIGRAAAFNKARNELWPLLGFRLADRLHEEAKFRKIFTGRIVHMGSPPRDVQLDDDGLDGPNR